MGEYIGARVGANEHRWIALLNAALEQPNPTSKLVKAIDGLKNIKGKGPRKTRSWIEKVGKLKRCKYCQQWLGILSKEKQRRHNRTCMFRCRVCRRGVDRDWAMAKMTKGTAVLNKDYHERAKYNTKPRRFGTSHRSSGIAAGVEQGIRSEAKEG